MFEEDIRHHENRAKYWMQQGKPDYAEGSLVKAAKWRDKQRALDLTINRAHPKSQADLLMDKMFDAFANSYKDRLEGLLVDGNIR